MTFQRRKTRGTMSWRVPFIYTQSRIFEGSTVPRRFIRALHREGGNYATSRTSVNANPSAGYRSNPDDAVGGMNVDQNYACGLIGSFVVDTPTCDEGRVTFQQL